MDYHPDLLPYLNEFARQQDNPEILQLQSSVETGASILTDNNKR